MKLLILPGFSKHNRGWADEAERVLADFEVITVYWKHWGEKGACVMPVNGQAELYEDLLQDKDFLILAKSVGTAVSLRLTRHFGKRVKKLILCGIPYFSLLKRKRLYEKVYQPFTRGKIYVFQNERDPLGSFIKIKNSLSPILPNIKFIKTPRSDHSYPFYDEFNNFFT